MGYVKVILEVIMIISRKLLGLFGLCSICLQIGALTRADIEAYKQSLKMQSDTIYDARRGIDDRLDAIRSAKPIISALTDAASGRHFAFTVFRNIEFGPIRTSGTFPQIRTQLGQISAELSRQEGYLIELQLQTLTQIVTNMNIQQQQLVHEFSEYLRRNRH